MVERPFLENIRVPSPDLEVKDMFTINIFLISYCFDIYTFTFTIKK